MSAPRRATGGYGSGKSGTGAGRNSMDLGGIAPPFRTSSEKGVELLARVLKAELQVHETRWNTTENHRIINKKNGLKKPKLQTSLGRGGRETETIGSPPPRWQERGVSSRVGGWELIYAPAIGAAGFEPALPWTQTKGFTAKLRAGRREDPAMVHGRGAHRDRPGENWGNLTRPSLG